MTKKPRSTTAHLKTSTLYEFCSTVLDSGYIGSPIEYLKEFYNKELEGVTNEELLKITKDLADKGPGALIDDGLQRTI